MRYFLSVFIGLLACLASAADLRERTLPAKLHLPQELGCPRGVSLNSLPFELEFTNASKSSLCVGLFVVGGRVKAGPFVEVEIQDSQSNRVPIWHFMSSAPPPQGNVDLIPRESLRIPLFIWNGSVNFPHEGAYRFRVTMTVTDSDKATVSLESDWREVQIKFTETKQSQGYQ